MAAAQVVENHGNDWSLTWYLWWGIYTSIPTWTHSQNSVAAAEAGVRYPPMEHLSNYHEDHLNQHQDSHKPHNKAGHPVLSLLESWWKQTTMSPEFPNWGKAIVGQTLASEEINKSKRAELWESQDPNRKVNYLSKVIWDRKITEFTRSISSTIIS